MCVLIGVVWCGVDRSGNYACYFAESVGSEEVGYVIMICHYMEMC
jgi:hypothetical protein